MSEQKVRKVRIGPKEKKILDFLAQHPEGIWRDELIRKFSWANKYDAIMVKRLYNMQKKGLIIIREELNPQSGRYKKRVYLAK